MQEKRAAIVERIDTLLKERNQTRKDLVSVGAIKSVQTITDWNERGTIPRADTALAIADYLGVTIRWLLTGVDEAGYSLEERNLVIKYRNLDDQGRYEIKALLDAKLSVPGEKRE